MNAQVVSDVLVASESKRSLGHPVRKNDWRTIPVFVGITLGSLIGGPIYIYQNGFPAEVAWLVAFFMVTTGLSITAGYHRLFSHRTFKANGLVRFLFLFFGAGAMEESAYRWSSQHREHHGFVDTDRDPYNIKKGFWYAHLGWMIFWDHVICYDNVKDLQKQRMVMHQHNNYLLWTVTSGVVLPLLMGALMGHVVGAFIFAVCFRLFIVYNATFFINSICHMFGKSTYDKNATAKDNWLIAFFTYGEGYHSFHHRFPRDYRNGVRFFDWDPSKWLIRGLAMIGMAWDLQKVTDEVIEKAKV